MHQRRSLIRRISLASVIVISLGVVIGLAGSSSGSYRLVSDIPASTRDEVGLEIRTVHVDPGNAALQFLAIPRANGELGQDLPNGAFFTNPVIFNLDVASTESSISVPGSTVRGAIPAEVFLQGTESDYPFDSYDARLFASASSNMPEGHAAFVLSDSQQVVTGFDIRAELVSVLGRGSGPEVLRSDQEAGFGMLVWQIQRSGATKFLAILLGLIMIAGALVSLAITVAIVLKRRPPTISVMVWLAVFLFALFQVRGQLPGSPPAGIGFDRFIFFPVILMLVLLIAVNLVAWSTRDDWDMENPGSPNGDADGRLAQADE